MHLIQDLIRVSADRDAAALALRQGARSLNYGTLATEVGRAAAGLQALGLARGDRVAVYLEKRLETVIGLFAAPQAGGVFVPINPQLKARQVQHILRDCNVRTLVTSKARLSALGAVVRDCPDLNALVLVDGPTEKPDGFTGDCLTWEELLATDQGLKSSEASVESDMAAILYTSGSTGLSKGVVLSVCARLSPDGSP